MGTYICVAESLHCSPETITTLLIGYMPEQNKTFKKNKEGLSRLNKQLIPKWKKGKQEPNTCWRGLRFPEVTGGPTVVCVPQQPLQVPVHTTVLWPAQCNPSSSAQAGRGVGEPTDIGSLARMPGLLPRSQESRLFPSVMDWLGQKNLLLCTDPLPAPGHDGLDARTVYFLPR